MTKILLVGAFAIITLAGCNKTPDLPADFPEVNDVNCAPDAIKRINDKDRQQLFADLCSRRGSYKDSPTRTY
jgi:entry exclusion lipoprotein TrbK